MDHLIWIIPVGLGFFFTIIGFSIQCKEGDNMVIGGIILVVLGLLIGIVTFVSEIMR